MTVLRPLFARVLLKREVPKKVGNIHVPEQFAKRNAGLKCEVVAVGPNADKSIKPGMTVLIGQYAGAWLDEDGNPVPDGDYYVTSDEDLICEIVDDAAENTKRSQVA